MFPASPVSPADNATGLPLLTTLRWSGGAANWWQVNIRNLRTNALHTSGTLPFNATSYPIPSSFMEAGTQYRWDVTSCVVACAANEATATSAASVFTTAVGATGVSALKR